MDRTEIEFKKNGWAVVKEFLSKEELDILYKQCKESVDKLKGNEILDEQCPLSPTFYNSKFLKDLQRKKLSEIEKICGKKLIGTYFCWRWYNKGEVLFPHIDRPDFEISATLFIKGDPWEISIIGNDGVTHTVQQEPGDAIIYMGRNLKHWREEFKGENHVQLFIHYIDKNGPNAKHKNHSGMTP